MVAVLHGWDVQRCNAEQAAANIFFFFLNIRKKLWLTAISQHHGHSKAESGELCVESIKSTR